MMTSEQVAEVKLRANNGYSYPGDVLDLVCEVERQRARAERAEAALATERVALQEFARSALFRTMSDLSEACWCAGWLDGMEYFLWNATENGKAIEWGMDNVYQRDIDDLRRLRELADGWWIWDDVTHETFVSLDDMRRKAQAQP